MKKGNIKNQDVLFLIILLLEFSMFQILRISFPIVFGSLLLLSYLVVQLPIYK